MNEELIGKKVSIREYGIEGDSEYMNLTVINVSDSIITLRDMNGKVRIINPSSPRIVEIKES